MNWEWLPHYIPLLIHGLYLTLVLLVSSVVIGGILAVPIGLVQVTGPWYLKLPAKAFCSFIRGTPLLIQLWLIYYGIGSLFPGIPGIRTSFLWPVLREGFYYAVLAFSLSFAGYEGEVMRGVSGCAARRTRSSAGHWHVTVESSHTRLVAACSTARVADAGG
jgi:polar amino acid transport system permease protein